MAKEISVSLSEEEAKFVLGALDRAPFQGLAAARAVATVAAKVASALQPRVAELRPLRAGAGPEANGDPE